MDTSTKYWFVCSNGKPIVWTGSESKKWVKENFVERTNRRDQRRCESSGRVFVPWNTFEQIVEARPWLSVKSAFFCLPSERCKLDGAPYGNGKYGVDDE